MPETTVTEKFQITIPKEVRDEMDLRPGEKVIVEKRDTDSILVRRHRRVRNPLEHLIGEKVYHRRVSVEELEEKIELR
ncbi:MAG: AbrB/MazE/SpoVT family DNA-binding domain-containing protein [Candidatus Bathyarchaeia archaeon]